MEKQELEPRTGARTLFLALLALSWIALVVWMWHAFRTPPSVAALNDTHPVPPPLPSDFLRHTVESLGQLLLVVILLWPWWRRHYIWRGVLATLALMAWFLFTVPLELNNMVWLHRRWLAFEIMALILAMIIAAISVAVRKGSLASAPEL